MELVSRKTLWDNSKDCHWIFLLSSERGMDALLGTSCIDFLFFQWVEGFRFLTPPALSQNLLTLFYGKQFHSASTQAQACMPSE